MGPAARGRPTASRWPALRYGVPGGGGRSGQRRPTHVLDGRHLVRELPEHRRARSGNSQPSTCAAQDDDSRCTVSRPEPVSKPTSPACPASSGATADHRSRSVAPAAGSSQPARRQRLIAASMRGPSARAHPRRIRLERTRGTRLEQTRGPPGPPTGRRAGRLPVPCGSCCPAWCRYPSRPMPDGARGRARRPGAHPGDRLERLLPGPCRPPPGRPAPRGHACGTGRGRPEIIASPAPRRLEVVTGQERARLQQPYSHRRGGPRSHGRSTGTG